MISTISYFGRPCPPDGRCEDMPRGNVDYFNISCPILRMRYLLEQALAAAMYVKFYGLRCHECISEYIDRLNNEIVYRFARDCGKKYTDNYKTIYNTLQDLVRFNRGGNWVDVDIKLVNEFIFDGNDTTKDFPAMWGDPKLKGYLVPFLMWMNKRCNIEGEFTAERCGVVSFEVANSYRDSSLYVRPRFHFIGRSFSFEKTPIDTIRNLPLLGMLSHFNLGEIKFEGLVGVMTEYCMHTDIERYGLSMTHALGYCLKLGLMYPVFDITGDHDGVDPVVPELCHQMFDALVAFSTFCTQRRGLTAVDKDIVAKAFGSVAATKEQKDSVAYLTSTSAVPSSDEYKSFKKTIGSVEAFSLISQNPSLVTAQTARPVVGATEAAEPAQGGGGNTEPKKPTDPDQAADGKKDNQEGEKKDEGNDDQNPPSNDDAGSDDFPTDDTPGGEDGSDNPDEGGTDAGSGDPNPDDSSVPSGDVPHEPDTSDERGIKFTIVPPESSTVDSVVFREEMYKFISNVLANPPKCMSPQDIDMLNKLRKYWLSSLSIDSIRSIVETCIRLPKSITKTNSKPQGGENL